MISIVIRNKNESESLKRTLQVLFQFYKNEFDEIIVVDNESTDDSVKVANEFNCKIVEISNFTYGKAINLGIENAKNDWILLLSSHSIPMGKHFFKNTMDFISAKEDMAGLRFVNNALNIERVLLDGFEVKKPLDFGLMAACCIVSKKVWNQFKFDEALVFSEDKEWSERVSKNGFKIYQINETFFYDIKRDKKSFFNRYKNETIAYYQLRSHLKFSSKSKVIFSFLYRITLKNIVSFFKKINHEYKLLKVNLMINKALKNDSKK